MWPIKAHTHRYVKLNVVNGASLLVPSTLMNLAIGIAMVRGYLVLVCVPQ